MWLLYRFRCAGTDQSEPLVQNLLLRRGYSQQRLCQHKGGRMLVKLVLEINFDILASLNYRSPRYYEGDAAWEYTSTAFKPSSVSPISRPFQNKSILATT